MYPTMDDCKAQVFGVHINHTEFVRRRLKSSSAPAAVVISSCFFVDAIHPLPFRIANSNREAQEPRSVTWLVGFTPNPPMETVYDFPLLFVAAERKVITKPWLLDFIGVLDTACLLLVLGTDYPSHISIKSQYTGRLKLQAYN